MLSNSVLFSVVLLLFAAGCQQTVRTSLQPIAPNAAVLSASGLTINSMSGVLSKANLVAARAALDAGYTHYTLEMLSNDTSEVQNYKAPDTLSGTYSENCLGLSCRGQFQGQYQQGYGGGTSSKPGATFAIRYYGAADAPQGAIDAQSVLDMASN